MSDEKKYSHPIFDRLVDAYGVKRGHGEVKKIAEITGVYPHTVSGWKTSGVPERIYLMAAIKTGVRVDWIETGEGPMRDEPPALEIKETPEIYDLLNDPDILAVVKMMGSEDKHIRSDIRLGVQKEKLLQGLLRQKDSNEKAG